MPNLIGGIVLGYIWQILLNGILGHFGRTLTYSSSYGFWGLIILMNWQQVGYMMIIYIAGIQNIPGELIEAGKNGRGVQLAVIEECYDSNGNAIHHDLYILNTDELFQTVRSEPGIDSRRAVNNSQMLALNIFETFYGRTGWEGVGQAKAVIFFIIVAVIALAQNRLTRTKEVQQ